MSSLRVLDDNVLLIQYTQEETRNGILIPKSSQAQEVKIICFVSAVGPNVQSPDLKEGTCVLIPKATGTWVPFEGFKYVLVKESDILAIIDGVEMKAKED